MPAGQGAELSPGITKGEVSRHMLTINQMQMQGINMFRNRRQFVIQSVQIHIMSKNVNNEFTITIAQCTVHTCELSRSKGKGHPVAEP